MQQKIKKGLLFGGAAFFSLLVLTNVTAQTIPTPRRTFSPVGMVNTIANGNDGQWLLTVADETVQVFHARTGLFVRKFDKHSATITALDANPRKHVAVSGDQTGHIYLWNTDDLSIVASYETQRGAIAKLKFAPDGMTFAATVGSSNLIRIFDIVNTKPIIKGDRSSSEISCAEFNTAQNSLLTGHADGAIVVWQLAKDSIRYVRQIDAHESKINAVKILRNGMILSLSNDKTLKIWEIKGNTTKMRKSIGLNDAAVAVQVSSDQKTATVVLASGYVLFFDLDTGSQIKSIQVKSGIKSAVFHPTESIVFATYGDNIVRSWILRE
jgi:WD40 repeat protein